MLSILPRVKEILLDPKAAWPRIEAEPATTASLYNPYLLMLAAVPVLATFIKYSIFGVGGFGFSYRVPVFTGLVQMVLTFGLILAMSYVMSLVVNALAPTFGGQPSPINALKLVVYGYTAGLVGGVFVLLPWIGPLLALLAGLYSLYLFYTGLPVLMKNPPERTLLYMLALAVCGLVLGLVLAMILSVLTPSHSPALGQAGGDAAVTIQTPQGEVKLDTSKLEAMAKKMEEAGKQMEQAQKSGDPAAAGQAAAAAMAALGGGAKREVVPASQLKAMLPDTALGLPRASFEAQSNGAMGFTISEAKAAYRDGSKQINLSITDAGTFSALAGLANWANVTTDRETDTEVERIGKQGQRTVREKYRKDGSDTDLTIILNGGIIVEARGQGVDAAALKSLLEGLDLSKLEALAAAPAK